MVVVGDLIYDVLARFDGPLAFGTDFFAPVHAQPGGSGANTAAWLARLGAETAFVARVGDDPLGRLLAEELARDGVVARLARDKGVETGKVVALVDGDGERTLITYRGAGENLSPEDLPEDLFGPGGHLHLSGYLFSGGARREAALAALERARANGMTTSVDPSSTTLLEALGPEEFLGWTTGVDLAFPNRAEGAVLAGTTEEDQILNTLLRHYANVVLKLGAGGAAYAGAGGERVRVPASPARVVDTTGAGDAACAGFLAAWLRGKGPEEALRGGVELAAEVVGKVGGRPAGR
ncbi:carbohydrate kinase family protein [Rubrobacter marinus]|uniref:carbohydrate kinase family protein n=1 Tax=Rubrobacter marinus TaxID=2653852 RepID=UPI0014089DF2|nr:sugar kinase [Rubrobacter marinus]